jgi:hypothetical protein
MGSLSIRTARRTTHLARRVHAFETRPLRRSPLQMRQVIMAVRRESEAPFGSALIADTADQAARVDPAIPMRLRSFSHWSIEPRDRQLAGGVMSSR